MKHIILYTFLLSLCFPIFAYDFQVDALCYTITDDSPQSRTVKLTNVDYDSIYHDLRIPEIVMHNDTLYKVTSIGDYAFLYNKNITNIFLPNSIIKIGISAFAYSSIYTIFIPCSILQINRWAFYGCEDLEYIYCEATTPPKIEKKIFSKTDKAIELYVPSVSIENYQAAKQWRDINNILPIEKTDILRLKEHQIELTDTIEKNQEGHLIYLPINRNVAY